MTQSSEDVTARGQDDTVEDTAELTAAFEVPQVVAIERWETFGRQVTMQLGERFARHYAFRGQSNAEYRLESSFDRRYAPLSFSRRKAIDESLTRRFHQIAERSEILPQERFANGRALGQHYGLSTRLLDWTESRYIAAFFAFAFLNNRYSTSLDAEKDNHSKVSVFALDVESPVIDRDHIELEVPSFSQSSERLRRQRGLFTRNRTDSPTLEDCLAAFIRQNPGECTRPPLLRFDINVSEARVVLRDLEEMRISFAELFPGYEGAAKEAMLEEWLGTSTDGGLISVLRGRQVES